jgi:hypothetical protein
MNNLNDTLPGLMHRATENLEPDSTDLLERTVQQGLRLRRRRTTLLTASGAGAVLATAGLVVGTTQVLGRPSDAAIAGTPVPSAVQTPTSKPITPKETLATLEQLISKPGRTVSQPTTWGGTKDGFLAASYIVDDGHGASRVEVLVSGGEQQDPCAPAGSGCTTDPDGSIVYASSERPEYSDGRQDRNRVVSSYVTVSRRGGGTISITSYNGPAQKGTKHTRTHPFFTVPQLVAMAKSTAWKFPPAPAGGPSKGAKPTK